MLAFVLQAKRYGSADYDPRRVLTRFEDLEPLSFRSGLVLTMLRVSIGSSHLDRVLPSAFKIVKVSQRNMF